MKKAILDYYHQYKTNGLPDNETSSIEKYSRKALAEEYVKLLEKTSENQAC